VHGNIDPTFLSSRQLDLCAYEVSVANGPQLQGTNRHDPVAVKTARQIIQDLIEVTLSWFMNIDGIVGWRDSKRDKPQTLRIHIDVEDPVEKFSIQLLKATILFQSIHTHASDHERPHFAFVFAVAFASAYAEKINHGRKKSFKKIAIFGAMFALEGWMCYE